MNVHKIILAFILVFLVSPLLQGNELRDWTDVDGRKTKGILVKVEGAAIEIRNASARVFTIPIERLSFVDKVYVEEWKKSLPPVTCYRITNGTKRVVFAVDFSTSMIKEGREKLMRKELIRTLKKLNRNVEYALIFFAGPTWFEGQKVEKPVMLADGGGAIVKEGAKKHIWYQGWDKNERQQILYQTANYHYSEGKDKLPSGTYSIATRSNIEKSIKQIEKSELVFGTSLRWPLRIAINMLPDTIFFITDSGFSPPRGESKEGLIDSILDYNANNAQARINTVGIAIPPEHTHLKTLAEKTGGQFSYVKKDGSIVGGNGIDGQASKKR